MRPTLLIAAAAVLAAAPLPAQTVAGRIFDRATERPVPEAVITALTPAGRVMQRARSDTAGNFTLALPRAGAYQLRAVRLGFQSFTSQGFEVGAKEELEVNLAMSTGTVELEPLTITSRAAPPRVPHLEQAGFYDRERHSPGTFMRLEDIRRTRSTHVSDVLTRLPGARRAVSRGKSVVTISRSGMGTRPCPPSVYVDGQPLMMSGAIDDLIHMEAVEAMEVYRGPSETPARFGSQEGGCGVVVIWTKRKV